MGRVGEREGGADPGAQVQVPDRPAVQAAPAGFAPALSSPAPADVLGLQRTIGNRAVGRLLGRQSTTTAPVIAKETPTRVRPDEAAAGAFAPTRAIGDRAVTHALVQRAPPSDPPTGVTLGADPLPAGANTAAPAGAKTAADPSVMGGWIDKDSSTLASTAVGAVDRILLEGLPGNALRDHQAGVADAMDATGGGRAIALVPRSLRTAPVGEVAVVVHFHGLGKGLRGRGVQPTDVLDYQMEQQLDAFAAARPGARIIALLPIGVTFGDPSKGQSVTFGGLKIDGFVAACFAKLMATSAAAVAALPAGATPGTVYLSAHSGGGLPLGSMMAAALSKAGSSALPARFGGVFGFESFHGDIDTWRAFLSRKLDEALAKLESLRAAGGVAAGITRDQLAYLRGSDSFRFIAFAGLGGYATRVKLLRDTLLGWWKGKAARLVAASGGDTSVLDQLWSNFQAQTFSGSTHVNALSKNNNFGRALASLPQVGPLAAPPPTPGGGASGAGSGTGMPATPTPGGGASGAGSGTRSDAGTMDSDAGTTRGSPDAGLVARAVRAPVPARRLLARAFTTQNYDLSTTPVTIVKASDKNKTAKVEEAPATYAAAILTNAGLDPGTWFDNFTTMTFLGIPVSEPIHVDLATHLQGVEKTFASKYGGPDNKAAEAGKALGIRTIGGSRKSPTSATISMHLFGLAIDVNYTANPFISASANPVFQRAAGLLGRTTTGFTSGMSYDDLSTLDKLLADYFALIDASAGDLQTALDAATAAPWKGTAPAAARKQIQTDLDDVAGRWERADPAKKAVIKAGGFMDLDKRFVQDIGLSWGATYGDVMHFDMRNKGSGAKIQAKIQAYKTTKEAESKANWAKDHPSPAHP